jgi:hypothetical protein
MVDFGRLFIGVSFKSPFYYSISYKRKNQKSGRAKQPSMADPLPARSPRQITRRL